MSIPRKHSQYIVIVLAVIIALLFIGTASARAHEFGYSFEENVDGSFIDIGYSVENFTDDASVIFSFEIKNEEGQPVPFTDVWVRIVKEKSTVFATGVHNARLGGALMTYKFPNVGEYEISARYQNNGKSVAAAVFPLTVEQGSKKTKNEGGVIRIVLGFLGGVFFMTTLLLVARRVKSKP